MHKKPKKIYDSDGEYLTAGEQAETKAYAKAILAAITAAKKKVGGNVEQQWVSGPELRRTVPGDISRWEPAIALLVEDIETREGPITQYRLHEMRPLNYKPGFAISQPSDKIRPHAAVVFGEEYAKAI